MSTPPHAPQLVHLPLEALGSDETFRLRDPGDVSSLAQSIAQVGQIFPVQVRAVDGRHQLITGFRRVAALQMLLRKRVLAQVHEGLGEEEAALLAVADSLDNRSLALEELHELLDRYRARGWASPALEELIARSIEKEEERLEDLEAHLLGEEPPDRSVADEDGDPSEDPPGREASRQTDAMGRTSERRQVPPGPQLKRRSRRAPAGPPLRPPSAPPLGGVVPASREDAAEGLLSRLASTTFELGSLFENWQEVPDHILAAVREELDATRALDRALAARPRHDLRPLAKDDR